MNDYQITTAQFRNGLTVRTTGTSRQLGFLVVTHDGNGRLRDHADISLPLRVSSQDMRAVRDALDIIWEHIASLFPNDLTINRP